MCQVVLNTLQLFLIETKYTSDERITIVQVTTDQGICSQEGYITSEILSNSLEVMYLEETGFTCPHNMFRERKYHTPRFQHQQDGEDFHRKVKREFVTLSLRTKNIKFCLIRVEFFIYLA